MRRAHAPRLRPQARARLLEIAADIAAREAAMTVGGVTDGPPAAESQADAGDDELSAALNGLSM
jgi:hypothetical protein